MSTMNSESHHRHPETWGSTLHESTQARPCIPLGPPQFHLGSPFPLKFLFSFFFFRFYRCSRLPFPPDSQSRSAAPTLFPPHSISRLLFSCFPLWPPRFSFLGACTLFSPDTLLFTPYPSNTVHATIAPPTEQFLLPVFPQASGLLPRYSMRSSIACARCRRSKIKCVNAGIDTTCRACESSGRECVYPTPAIGVSGSKRDLTALADGDDRNGDWDGPKRPRARKSIGMAGSVAGSKAGMDALDSSILTTKVWEAAFDLFQSHFATLLPFLHPATFLSQIRQLSSPPAAPVDGQDAMRNPGSKMDPSSSLIPLGVLALTARFHPPLVAYHSPASPGHPSNPLAASDFYAAALRSRLAGLDGVSLAIPDLARVQALLMLALHEWGMCRGKSAWVYVGMAIRLAQAMGLPFELENEFPPRDMMRASPGLKAEVDHFGLPRRPEPKEQSSDDIISQETKRRTFWSCFILDRCLSSGKYRPRMIRVKELGIQLPSDNAFAFGERVRTVRLNEPPARRPPSLGAQGMQIPSIRQSLLYGDEKLPAANGTPDGKAWSPISRRKDSSEDDVDRWEVGAEESVLSRVIRVIRIWGSIAKWSCAGGRR